MHFYSVTNTHHFGNTAQDDLQDSKKKKLRCGKSKVSSKQTRLSYSVKSLTNTAVWNIAPDPKRRKKKKENAQNARTSRTSEIGFKGLTRRKVRKICLLTILKCADGEINTRKLSTDEMCFPCF